MTPPASASSGGEEHSFDFDPLETSEDRIKTGDHIPLDHFNDKKPFYCRGGKLSKKFINLFFISHLPIAVELLNPASGLPVLQAAQYRTITFPRLSEEKPL